jgi:hypothetical protein
MAKPTNSMWHETTSYWKKRKWNFSNCIGSSDGKYIEIKYAVNSGSQNYNYKQYFSMLLQALVDAGCKLIGVDIGAVERRRDGEHF